MRTQAERARSFRALHERPGIFIMPNPWDAGTAKLLASLGFEALATNSLGFASSPRACRRHAFYRSRGTDRQLS